MAGFFPGRRLSDLLYTRRMLDKQELFESAREYLMRHPEEVLRVVKNAFLLRLGVPLDALRWLATKAGGRKAPKDVQIEAVPPGVRVGATLDLMGAVLRASAILYVEDVRIDSKQVRFDLRLADVDLKLLGESESPVATLIKSGALDLSKPGNLVAYMPKRPPMIVEAADDRICLDLMKHPALDDAKVEMVLGLVTPFITVGAIRTDWEHLDVVFKPLQEGLGRALEQVRERL
jgi:hypothetical protein